MFRDFSWLNKGTILLGDDGHWRCCKTSNLGWRRPGQNRSSEWGRGQRQTYSSDLPLPARCSAPDLRVGTCATFTSSILKPRSHSRILYFADDTPLPICFPSSSFFLPFQDIAADATLTARPPLPPQTVPLSLFDVINHIPPTTSPPHTVFVHPVKRGCPRPLLNMAPCQR